MILHAPATAADVAALILREEDLNEVSPGWRERIVANLDSTWAFTDQEGALLGLGGIQRHPGLSTPWLLCSPLVASHRASAFRMARMVTCNLAESASETVGNFIPKDAHANRRFVQALGFLILESPAGFDFFYLPHV